MKTKDRQIGWHLFLVVVVFLLLMPIVFAISNSFKTMQEAFNTVFQVIPLHPTLENYRHVFGQTAVCENHAEYVSDCIDGHDF